jgi:hypothetical protein
MSKHSNLSNKTSDPAKAPLDVVCVVHFDLYGAVPKGKLAEWLASLPEQARVKCEGLSQGKVFFEATWKEER